MSTMVHGYIVDPGEDSSGERIARHVVLRELRLHDVAPGSEREHEFFEKFGPRPDYDAQEVLAWLGH